MTAPLYFEDLSVGQTFGTGTVTVEPETLKAFAAEFDPQPLHLDEDAARASVFGGLVASGWHTAALTMKLLVGGELQVVGGLIGLGAEELRWPRPVHPGDQQRQAGGLPAVTGHHGERAGRADPHRHRGIGQRLAVTQHECPREAPVVAGGATHHGHGHAGDPVDAVE